MTDLRDKIAAAIDRRYNDEAIGHTYEVCLHAADAVIRELTPILLDFGEWLAEEVGFRLTPVDLQSCLEDWRGD